MVDPLVEVAVRVYADFAEHATLTDVLAVIARCRNDLRHAQQPRRYPRLVERLARQRLTDHVAPRATANGSRPAEH